jgi:alginate O-acetyltransferase complex protein AlgI
MLFSSTVFLFAFLPLVLTVAFVLRSIAARNAWLLAVSLLFYAWGEAIYVLLLLASIGFNGVCGAWIGRLQGRAAARRVLVVGVVANLSLLAVFKYANFFVGNLSASLVWLGVEPLALEPVHLPIGISFFTFQALTYLVDVYRREAPVARSAVHVALYISLFPQLIAGPIVRYRHVAAELAERSATREQIAAGLRRFVVGLGKKVLIANTLAVPADRAFAAGPDELTLVTAWVGAICFALQIYFDFSGYSDMAIGLGRVLGFHFPENFSYPYMSRSIRDFWRRWHISLSTWFRDYLYIPLGGNQRTALRTTANLFTVFLLCGLWHGASWTFVVWGLLHGAFLALERAGLGRRLERAGTLVARCYTLSVVLIAWVFFRADDLGHAVRYLGAMFAQTQAAGPGPLAAIELLKPDVGLALAAALLGSTPWLQTLVRDGPDSEADTSLVVRRLSLVPATLRLTWTGLVLLGCAMSLAAGSYNPFIYFRF